MLCQHFFDLIFLDLAAIAPLILRKPDLIGYISGSRAFKSMGYRGHLAKGDFLSELGGLSVVDTDDGSVTLYSAEFAETFHSTLGAWREAEELYLRHNGIMQGLAEGSPLLVLDVGLGLGYNAVSCILQWLSAASPAPLQLLSLEINAALVASLVGAKTPWMANWSEPQLNIVRTLRSYHDGYRAVFRHCNGAQCTWQVALGDASLGQWLQWVPEPLTHIMQDAFSPLKNPSLWSVPWFTKLAEVCAPGARLATYSVARRVKDHLAEVGFLFEKVKAPGRKRQWLIARWP